MKNYQAGDRVVLNDRSLQQHNEYEDNSVRGVVQEVKGDKLLVKWDYSWHRPNPQEVSVEEVVSEDEANKILSKLEEEYEAWAAPIREKIAAAAELLIEAGDLAGKKKLDLAGMRQLANPLLSAMDNLGWRTSSFSC